MWELDLGDGGGALWAPVAVYTRKPREASFPCSGCALTTTFAYPFTALSPARQRPVPVPIERTFPAKDLTSYTLRLSMVRMKTTILVSLGAEVCGEVKWEGLCAKRIWSWSLLRNQRAGAARAPLKGRRETGFSGASGLSPSVTTRGT